MEDTTTITEIEAIIENGLGTAEGFYKIPYEYELQVYSNATFSIINFLPYFYHHFPE